LYAGCWDKSIWSWDATTRALRRRYFGHADFVKAVVCVRAPWLSPALDASSSDGDDGDLLISGGADACIIVWRASNGTKLHTLRGHTRGILSLAIAPLFLFSSLPNDDDQFSNSTARSTLELFSAGSDPSIRRWQLTPDSARELAAVHTHATSVDAIRFHVPLDATLPEDVELWTASADKTAQCLTPPPSATGNVATDAATATATAASSWTPHTTLPHADFVRDVLAVPGEGLVVTACRDEGVRVWDTSGDGDGDDDGDDAAACVHVYDGHYDEVTALASVKGGRQVVSVGIDGTVRCWDAGRAAVLGAREEARRREAEKSNAAPPAAAAAAAAVRSLLTAEEEAELAALMDEDDE